MELFFSFLKLSICHMNFFCSTYFIKKIIKPMNHAEDIFLTEEKLTKADKGSQYL